MRFNRVAIVIVILTLSAVLPCAATESLKLESRATRVIWKGELERLNEFGSSAKACQTVNVSRMEASAMALDNLTGLKLKDEIDWRNPLINRAEVRRVVKTVADMARAQQ
jgi:hypothetical protein